MATKEDIEGFLDRLTDGANHTEVKPGMWVIKPGGALDFDVVVHFSPPVVILRVLVMTLPSKPDRRAALNHRLLELNAHELVHCAYGIEDDSIVMTGALELDHLDYEEFQSAYESITVALAQQLREIGTFREGQ